MLSHFSCVQLCDPVDCKAPQSMGFSRQEWVAVPSSRGSFLQGIFLTQGLNPHFLYLALAGGCFTISTS